MREATCRGECLLNVAMLLVFISFFECLITFVSEDILSKDEVI